MALYLGDNLIAGSVSCPFPVGSIMFMATATDPSTYFPGTTWAKMEDGRFLRNQTDSTKLGSKGGSDELYALVGPGWKSGYGTDGNYMMFEQSAQWQNNRDNSKDYIITDGSKGLGWSIKTETDFTAGASRVIESGKKASTASDKNKINPLYIDVAMWKRTA